MTELTWVKVPVIEVAYGHLGRHIRATDGAVSVEGLLVAVMHGKKDGHVFSQMVVSTESESVVQINTCSEEDTVELSLEKQS